MLKAASAAGVVWASPVLESVTAHASGTCAYVEIDATSGPVLVTTDSTTDGASTGCTSAQLNSCAPSGTGSLGGFCGFPVGASTLPGGTWNAGMRIYTAPSGYTILGATARRFVAGGIGSGCNFTWPCNVYSMLDASSFTFPAPAGGSVYTKFRIVLCS